jgi:hypothetical protein
MTEKIDLKKLEKRTYLTYMQDGLLELCIGVVLLLSGIGGVFLDIQMIIFVGATVAVILPVYASIKMAVTRPRIGLVKFAPKRQKRLSLNFILLFVLGTASFLAGMFMFLSRMGGTTPEWFVYLVENGILIMGIIAAAFCTLEAWMLELKRLYAYAVVFLAIFVAGHFLLMPFWYYLLLTGAVLTAIGMVMLVRFLRMYPKHKKDIPYQGSSQ